MSITISSDKVILKINSKTYKLKCYKEDNTIRYYQHFHPETGNEEGYATLIKCNPEHREQILNFIRLLENES